MKRNRVSKICFSCKKQFESCPSQKRKFCSKECLYIGKSVIIKCLNCKKDFKIWISRINKTKYCSKICASSSEEFKDKIRQANKTYKHRFKQGHNPWNKGKQWKEMSGKNHPLWKGGQIATKDKYIKILIKGHPRADCYGYVLRSHIVVEKAIGRYLELGEVVHHINHNRIDDRLENLYLFSKQRDHRKFHILERRGERIKSNII